MPLVRRQLQRGAAAVSGSAGRRRVHETVRRMVNELVVDVIQSSVERLRAAAPADIEAVRAHERALIGMSARDARRSTSSSSSSCASTSIAISACCA